MRLKILTELYLMSMFVTLNLYKKEVQDIVMAEEVKSRSI